MYRVVLNNASGKLVKIYHYTGYTVEDIELIFKDFVKELPSGWYADVFDCDSENEPSKKLLKTIK